jgi:hypothetical protein
VVLRELAVSHSRNPARRFTTVIALSNLKKELDSNLTILKLSLVLNSGYLVREETELIGCMGAWLKSMKMLEKSTGLRFESFRNKSTSLASFLLERTNENY